LRISISIWSGDHSKSTFLKKGFTAGFTEGSSTQNNADTFLLGLGYDQHSTADSTSRVARIDLHLPWRLLTGIGFDLVMN